VFKFYGVELIRVLKLKSSNSCLSVVSCLIKINENCYGSCNVEFFGVCEGGRSNNVVEMEQSCAANV